MSSHLFMDVLVLFYRRLRIIGIGPPRASLLTALPTLHVSMRSEKSDPFAVENLDSNNVLEMEIAACSSKAKSGDLAAVMRKGALETKLLVRFIVSQCIWRPGAT